MRKSRNKIITMLMLLILVLAGCTQQIVKEDESIKTIVPEKEKEKVVARITLPNEGPQTRTILPGKLGQADHYTLTFTRKDITADPISKGNMTVTEGTNYIEIVGLEIGTYDVEAKGYNAEEVLIYTGKSAEPLKIIDLENITTITIDLIPTIAENTTGNIMVKFDWTSLVDKNNIATISESNELKAKGPISTAIEQGTLKFIIYTANIGEPLVQRGEPIVCSNANTTNSMECLFTGIPTGDNIAVAFSILDKDNKVIVDKKYSITAQVFTDQTSYWNGSEDYVLSIKSNMDKWYSNISDIQIEYPTENVDSSVILTWDARTDRNGNPIYKSIIFTVNEKASGTQIGEPIVFTPAKSKENKITVTGLTPRTEYTVNTETISLGGKHSNEFQWTADVDKGFTTKVEVESIVINNDIVRDVMSTGDSFKMTASITPADASYNLLTWTATEPETLTITTAATSLEEDVIITANKPGITKIHVKNNDPKVDKSATTANDITIRLAQPKEMKANFARNELGQTEGIMVSWATVPFAENYELLRKVDNGAFENYKTINAQENLPEHSFLDTDLKTGSTYQYKVVANAPTIDEKYTSTNPGFSATSIESATSDIVEVSKPHFIMKPIDFKQNTFELTATDTGTDTSDSIISNGDIKVIKVEAGETIKVALNAPVAGYSDKATYTWSMNAMRDVILEGTYEQANTIEINSSLAGLDVGEDGVQELNISVYEKDKGTQSILLHFSVITQPVESVAFSDSNKNRMATNEPGLALKAYAYPKTATLKDVLYRVKSGDAADIDKDSGTITLTEKGLANGGEVVFEAYSLENGSIVSAPFTVNFYKPSVKTPEELIIEINKELDTHITKANSSYDHFGVSGETGSRIGDWWQYSDTPAWKNSTGTISMKANHSALSDKQYRYEDAGIFINNHVIENLGTIGQVNLNAKRIRIWAADTEGAGNLGYDPLHKIGARTSDTSLNKIVVDLPYNQGKATIEYDEVNVLEFNSGDYYITFENEIYVPGGTNIVANKRYHFGVVDQHDKDGNLTAKGIGVPFDRK